MVAGALGVWSTGTRTRAEVVRFAIELPPGTSLGSRIVAISADGRRVAYAAVADGKSALHFRAMDEIESREIPGTEWALAPFFSPDGDWVGFVAGGSLQKVSWDGGLPSTLCQIPSFFGGAFWSEDDHIVYSDTASGLFRVSASRGEPEFLGSADRKSLTGGYSPNLLPGGEAVLISQGTDDGWQFGTYHLDTGEWRVLGEGSNPLYVTTGHIVYSHENSLRAIGFNPATLEPRGNAVSILDGVGSMAISNDGTLVFVSPLARVTKLVSVREHEQGARTLTEDRYRYYRPRFSPDGRTVAVTALRLGIFTYDVERSTRIRVMGPEAYSSEWTPDGNRIAFYSSASGSGDVFWKSADGTGEAEPLLTREHPQWPSSFSPGGDWLAFSELHPETGRDIWMLPLQGDRSPTPFLVTSAKERMARFSPDGRFVAFVSDDSGRDEVYVLPFPGPGPKVSISPRGGTAPMWSRDGRRLFYQLAPQMLAVDIRYGPTLSVSAPTVLFEGTYRNPSDRDFAQYDVGPGDVGFVMVQADDTPEQRRIHVMLNWLEELKRLAPAN